MSSSTASNLPTRDASSFASLTPNNLGTVRKLNSVLFPIKYSEKFTKTSSCPRSRTSANSCTITMSLVRLGTVCCRLENKDGQVSLYLMTMGILAPYRSRQLGSTSLKLVLDAAAAHTKPKIDRIYLHVQISNADAKKFYERHGFAEIGVHENYYKKIVPHDAWILEKRFTETK
ncbi:N-alpha-acetyltransferase 50 [Mycena venus]|uniref:N-alpha-acetyltransferase 50 n=1 Tax=Mycena venus TaxID=2733690 RepID=A0A8H6YPR8_9AGAR|nr:N-alpha-acetyltransferase 50 [Mycena venus]